MDINEAINLTKAKQKECQDRHEKIYAVAFGAVGALIVAATALSFLTDLALMIVLVVSLPLLIAGFVLVPSKLDEIKAEYLLFYKQTFINAVVKSISSNLKYEPQRGISEREFASAGIFRKIKFSGEDEISGEWGGVKFSLSEAMAGERMYLKTDNLYVQLAMVAKALFDAYMDFKGSVLVCEFHKKFRAQTIIASRELNTKIFGDKELMDDAEFRDEFRVFTDDKIEARYLLTPALMERLSGLKRNLDVSLSAAFMDDKFYVFLNGAPNRFETTLFFDAASTEKAREYEEQIREILGIIDELNLAIKD